MAWAMVAGAAISVVGGVINNKNQKKAAAKAADAQTQTSELGIEEQRRQFDAIQKLLEPYVNAGGPALDGQQDILGLNGVDQQKMAINGIASSPMYTDLARQGEEAILQNASATGGLRGGNTQGALAQFRPQLLNQLIDQQYQRLGGLTNLGQASAAGVGAAGQQTGNAVTALLQQQGAAQAGQHLAVGRANSEMINGITKQVGTIAGKF
jgi:hypothetical protein